MILEVDTAYPLLKIIDFPWLINCQSMMYDIGHRSRSIADVCLPYLEILNTIKEPTLTFSSQYNSGTLLKLQALSFHESRNYEDFACYNTYLISCSAGSLYSLGDL